MLEAALLTTVVLASASPVEVSLPVPRFLDEVSVFLRGRQPVIYVEAAEGVPLEQLVKLEAFGDFRPGLSLRAAERRYGSPLYRRTSPGRTARYIGYDTPLGTVEVADQDWSSPPFYWLRRRSLYLYPRASTAPAGRSWFFRPSLLVYVPPVPGRHEVIVAEESQRVWCQFLGPRLISVNWMD